MNKTEDDLNSIQKKLSKGSHEVLINQIEIFIKEKTKNNIDDRDFNNSINKLKRLRIEADYLNLMIESKKSLDSINLCDQTQKILKKCI